MRDEECVQFLQWACPQLRMRWPGYRKVRNQVCKRLQRRINQLGIRDVADYRYYLEQHDREWQVLDRLCRVTISRFYRDKQMFAFLESEVLPALVQRAIARGSNCLRVWSVGAGAGEEPYTLNIIWKLLFEPQFARMQLQILATEVNPDLLERARRACYAYGSIKNLPQQWLDSVFDRQDEQYCLKLGYRNGVRFLEHDIRDDFKDELLTDSFDLVLCRNLVFTYFDEALQEHTFLRIMSVLRERGILVLGIHEKLPTNVAGVSAWSERLRIYEKT
ncbi:MAG: CheR family methyltransferase [Thioalkalispiraceae bacterium]|jgi:chemotaxis protein methyltransferase CheR